MAENKVQFNLRNVHYAMVTESGYGTPKKLPGAVNLDLSPAGEQTTFYADGIAYYVTNANNGYTGSIEMARFTDEFYKDVYGFTADTNKVLTENSFVETKPIALLFQIDGDADESLYCLYNVTMGRPNVAGQTQEASKTVQTQSADITAAPLDSGKIFARTTAETPKATKDNWFKAVYTGAESA